MGVSLIPNVDLSGDVDGYVTIRAIDLKRMVRRIAVLEADLADLEAAYLAAPGSAEPEGE